MSHTVKIKAKIDSPEDLVQACRRLGIDTPADGTHRIYSRTAEGLAVKLPGWRWPVVFDLNKGEAIYDNYGGSWGAEDQLTDFLNAHDIERTKRVYQEQGRHVVEVELPENAGVQLVEEVWS